VRIPVSAVVELLDIVGGLAGRIPRARVYSFVRSTLGEVWVRDCICRRNTELLVLLRSSVQR